jgi:hypothetical protein
MGSAHRGDAVQDAVELARLGAEIDEAMSNLRLHTTRAQEAQAGQAVARDEAVSKLDAALHALVRQSASQEAAAAAGGAAAADGGGTEIVGRARPRARRAAGRSRRQPNGPER